MAQNAAAQLLNQVGHLQHWGISPALNFLSHRKDSPDPIRVLLTGTSDIRHILKTLTDIDIEGREGPKKIEIYFHEMNKQLICRALLFLHIIHETHLNFEERVELFLDLYGNALIKQRNSRYLDRIRVDLLNFIHSEKKNNNTPLNKFVKLKMLKFQEVDELSEFVQSWSRKAEFDIEKLRDQRLRYLFKERYDYRNNLTDWDYNMLLTQFAPLVHFYHYREWRLTGLAFEQRFSTYTQPNRTLASYISGRKKQQRTSCLVRGYWGDLIISPYISMGIDTNSQQKELLFKKANLKYIGHSVELTEYNLTYWLTRLQTGQTYVKYFRDYYRTDQEGRKKLEQEKNQKGKKKQSDLKAIKEEEEEIRQEEPETKQEETKIEEPKEDEDLNSEEEERKKRITLKNREDIKTVIEDTEKNQGVLKILEKYGLEVLPICTPIQNMISKAKFKQFFDVAVVGFFHSAFFTKGFQTLMKADGQIFIQKSRYIVPKKKEERIELDKKLQQISTNDKWKVIDDSTDYFVIKQQ